MLSLIQSASSFQCLRYSKNASNINKFESIAFSNQINSITELRKENTLNNYKQLVTLSHFINKDHSYDADLQEYELKNELKLKMQNLGFKVVDEEWMIDGNKAHLGCGDYYGISIIELWNAIILVVQEDSKLFKFNRQWKN